MREFSATQSNRIAQASMEISRRRGIVERTNEELDTVKENVKVAKQELESAYRALDAITMDAASGIEPLPNLFSVNSADREQTREPALAAHYRDSENVIRPKRRKESQEDAG